MAQIKAEIKYSNAKQEMFYLKHHQILESEYEIWFGCFYRFLNGRLSEFVSLKFFH